MNNDNTTVPTTISIQGVEVQTITYRGERVATFDQVDRVHKRPEGTAGRTFRENRSRFIAGEDYIELTSDEIRRMSAEGLLPPRTARATLITRRGYLKLVKPLTDDRAWAVQGEMIDRYFMIEEIGVATARKMVNDAREARLQFRQNLSIAKMIGLSGNQAALAANRGTLALTGFDVLASMGATHLQAPQNEALLNVTEVGSRLGGKSAIYVNALLVELGFQLSFTDAKGRPYYEPTQKGVEAGAVMQDTGKRHSNGTPIRQLKWASGIVETLREALACVGEAA